MPRKTTTEDYPAAFLARCDQCSSIYLIGLANEGSALANVCSVFVNNYKCPGRMVSMVHEAQSIEAFLTVLKMLTQDLENENDLS